MRRRRGLVMSFGFEVLSWPAGAVAGEGILMICAVVSIGMVEVMMWSFFAIESV